MAKRRASLTGGWSGAFRYPDASYPEIVFSARIEERGGAFVGETQQPNLERPWLSASIFTAEIEGVRIGAQVTFTKFYNAEAQANFAVRYEGEANDALTRIEGIWINPSWSGTFFMVRDDDGAEAEAEAEAEAPLLARRWRKPLKWPD